MKFILKFLSAMQKSNITYAGPEEVTSAHILVEFSWFSKSVEVGLAK